MLYTRRDIVALIGREALHIEGVDQIDNCRVASQSKYRITGSLSLRDRFPRLGAKRRWRTSFNSDD
jgi:hypothetical protein